jgi:hypothetical protein
MGLLVNSGIAGSTSLFRDEMTIGFTPSIARLASSAGSRKRLKTPSKIEFTRHAC